MNYSKYHVFPYVTLSSAVPRWKLQYVVRTKQLAAYIVQEVSCYGIDERKEQLHQVPRYCYLVYTIILHE